MSHSMAFDTLAYAKKLKEAGFTEKQAEVQAEILFEVVDEQLAKKSDIKESENTLRHEIKESETNLRREMKESEANLRREMKESEANLRREMKDLELRLTIRLGIMIAASITIVAVLVKLL